PPLFVRGTLVHTPVRGEVELLPDQLVAVDEAGTITAVVPGSQEAACLAAHAGRPEDVLRLEANQFLLPGFCDTHIHASQYSYAGTATDTPLMAWLTKYTFPTEARFAADPSFARRVYSRLICRMVACGTTTALFFATLHLEPCQLLADLLEEAGMRAFVGKARLRGGVSMDRHGGPDLYVESTEQAAASAEAFIRYVRAKQLPRLEPALTPRFLPTCTPVLLRALGELAVRYDVAVQSHIRESYDEVEFVGQLEEAGQGASEAEMFDAAGLLTSKASCCSAVFAHGVLLSDAEVALMAARGSAVAHCPLSNAFFADVVLPVAQLLRRGLKVGLGTDVAGGYDISMLGAQRAAVVASRALPLALRLQQEGDPDSLSWRDALWLATVGGARALGLDRVGTLAPGQQFDALLVDGGCGAAYDLFPQSSPLEQVEKFLCCGDDRHIVQVWVQGRPI
ncbi:hypothetical protein CHLNCDRAFT_8558, partial [Chlorella variabilis]